jgi:pimeloyl-ACP methyl ester carboxylesterase
MDRPVNRQMNTARREQTRVRYPDECGHAKRDGVRVYYEACGNAEPTILFLPTWEIVHSRTWEVPDSLLHPPWPNGDVRPARQQAFRPPPDVGAYDRRATVGDALAVLDNARAERVVVSWCGAGDDRILAVEHPERVAGLVLIGPDLLLTDDPADEEGRYPLDAEPTTPESWAKWNRHYFLRDALTAEEDNAGIPVVTRNLGSPDCSGRPSGIPRPRRTNNPALDRPAEAALVWAHLRRISRAKRCPAQTTARNGRTMPRCAGSPTMSGM